MSDRFRTVVWEHHYPDTIISPIETGPADRQMADAGFVLVAVDTMLAETRRFTVRIYERRPPTAQEAGDAMAELLRDWIRATDTPTDATMTDAVLAWRDAVGREEAP